MPADPTIDLFLKMCRGCVSLNYKNPDFQFDYPNGWELIETPSRDVLTVSLQSPFSMFMFLSCFDTGHTPDELADEALSALEAEYEDIESSPAAEPIAGVPSIGHDVGFFSLDLTNTCWIRALTSGEHTIIIFAQTTDLDIERAEAAFRAVCASLKLGSEAEPG